MYRLRLSQPAERWLDEELDHENRVRVLGLLGALCQTAERPTGVRIRGYEPPAYFYFLPDSDIAVTYTVFHRSRDLLVLLLEQPTDVTG